MKARHAIIRIAVLLAFNCSFLAFFAFAPDLRLHGWVLTALGGIFTFSDASLALVLKGFDEIEADSTLSSGAFRNLRVALRGRRDLLKPMMPVNAVFRLFNIACGLILVNRPEIGGAYLVMVFGYLCASFGLQSGITLIANLLDISVFKSNQRAQSRAATATSQLRAKLRDQVKSLAI